MKIKKIELFELEIPFKETFKHSLTERKKNTSLFLKLTDSTGLVGWGGIDSQKVFNRRNNKLVS